MLDLCTACLTVAFFLFFYIIQSKHESPLYCKTTASKVSPECRLYHRQSNHIQLSFYRGGNITAVCCFNSLKRGDEVETEQNGERNNSVGWTVEFQWVRQRQKNMHMMTKCKITDDSHKILFRDI